MEKDLIRKNEFMGVISHKKGGFWTYFMQKADGTEIQLRRSGRKYELAHFYKDPVAGGNKIGLKRHFTFGKKPDRYYLDLHLETFIITHLEGK